MTRRTVVLLPGDGIGPVVVRAARRVLEAVGLDVDWLPADIGWACWMAAGEALPERTVARLAEHRVGLLGAVTSRPLAETEDALPPALRGQGRRYFSPILAMRQRLGLHVAIRPCQSVPGHPRGFVRRGRDGIIEAPAIDAVVVMENTECHFAGVEWTAPPPAVRQALGTHPRMARFAALAGADLAVSCRVMSRPGCLRAAEAAFDHARQHGYGRVTLVDKWGVVAETASLMQRAAEEVAARHPDIPLELANVDALLLSVARTPDQYGVLLCSAFVGDLVSDAFAGTVGGLGFAPCANLGDTCAGFESTHGSAPKYAGLDPPIANPIAAILAGALLCDHLGEPERALRIRRAVARVVSEGRVRTFDLLGIPGGPDAVAQGAASTFAMTDAIIAAL